MRPPLQPEFCLEQSTNCCSLRDSKLPVAISHCPSKPPVEEKAQQDPHWPWSFTGVTAPLVDQSMLAGAALPEDWWEPILGMSPCAGFLKPSKDFLYSSLLMAAKG